MIGTIRLSGTLHRIVSMLARLITGSEVVGEATAIYTTGVEYEYRDAEYEYKYEGEPNRFAFLGVRQLVSISGDECFSRYHRRSDNAT